LNKTLLDLMRQASRSKPSPKKKDDFSWFIGLGPLDQETLDAIADMDKMSKAKQAKEWPL
jgi:hypothetical protein